MNVSRFLEPYLKSVPSKTHCQANLKDFWKHFTLIWYIIVNTSNKTLCSTTQRAFAFSTACATKWFTCGVKRAVHALRRTYNTRDCYPIDGFRIFFSLKWTRKCHVILTTFYRFAARLLLVMGARITIGIRVEEGHDRFLKITTLS